MISTLVGSIERFSSVLKELKGEPHVAKNVDEAVSTLMEIMKLDKSSEVVAAGIQGSGILEQIMKASTLSGVTIHVLEKLKGTESAVTVCERAQAGVTWAEYGIASQGAIVEVAYDDVAKLASSLPLVSIVLLPASRILADLPEALEKIGTLLSNASSARTPLPVISLISGPSKTSDIELRLLYGVHGPNVLHVIVLQWL